MNQPEQIITIDDFVEYSFKEKGSAFTGQVFHCESEEELKTIISSVRKKYYNATHHCFAFKLLNGEFKYSDDGEPNGTAGIRIFNAIEHFGLVDLVVVVIRYFGGTKLGVGPLGKAYHKAAISTLDKSIKIRKSLFELIVIECDFEHNSHIHRLISNHNATIAKTDYREKAIFECLVKPVELESLKKQLNELTRGKIKISPPKAKYYK